MTAYTHQRMIEGLAAGIDSLLARIDMRLAHAVPDPVAWAEKVSGTELDAWQRDVLRSEEPAVLLLTSRQVGKTHTVSLLAAYTARWKGYRVGLLSPSLRQSSLAYRRVRKWLRADGVRIERQTLTELEMEGGGSIVALPGDRPDLSIRGDTLDVLVVDEASRIRDELLAAATPTIATKPHARLIYLSSPAGRRGAFHKAWEHERGWHKLRVTADQCPRITPAFLDRERERLGPAMFSQEYQCEFVASAGGVFDPAAIEALFAAAPRAAEAWLPEIAGSSLSGSQPAQAW